MRPSCLQDPAYFFFLPFLRIKNCNSYRTDVDGKGSSQLSAPKATNYIVSLRNTAYNGKSEPIELHFSYRSFLYSKVICSKSLCYVYIFTLDFFTNYLNFLHAEKTKAV